MPVTNPSQPAPQRLGRYRIDDILGHGALGTVYRGFDPRGQRMVAIKALHPGISGGPVGLRLLEQARAVARLAHPNIVAVHEVEDAPRQSFIVMEYVAGLNLAQWLAATPLPPHSLLLQVMDQLLEAMALAHHAGLRHGGIKATNVLLTPTGLVKLSDFGVARLEDGALVPGAQPEMLAPEVALGRPIDVGVDIYAAGVLLYRMLTGRDPVVGAPAEETPSARIGAARAPSTFAEARRPAAFDAIVARAMAREPGERFPSAEAFRDALGVRFDHPRPVHGGGSVELAKTVAVPAPAEAPPPAPVPPRVAAFAAKAAKAAARGEPEGTAPAKPKPAPRAAGNVPVLTIAIPDEVLSMPAFDPWSDSAHGPEAEPPRRAERAVAAADEGDDDDLDTVSGILPMDEEAYRAFIEQVEQERLEQQAAAAEIPASPPVPARPPKAQAQAPTRVEPAARPEPAVAGPAPKAPKAPMAPIAEPAPQDGIPMEALRRALKIMTPHFGAAAGTVLKQVAPHARSIEELHDLILDRAGETIDRRKMRKQLKALAKLPL